MFSTNPTITFRGVITVPPSLGDRVLNPREAALIEHFPESDHLVGRLNPGDAALVAELPHLIANAFGTTGAPLKVTHIEDPVLEGQQVTFTATCEYIL